MPTSSETLSILVISDFHACCNPPSGRSRRESPSYYIVNGGRGGRDVKKDFLGQLAAEKTNVDVVVCCGDLIDRTDTNALGDAWSFANEVKNAVSASHLLVSTGNHDVDWKGTTDSYLPFEKLKGLESPKYPTTDETERHSYWSQHYFIRDIDEARFVVLNSCSGMGYKNHDFGLYAPEMEQVIKDLRRKPDRKPINICVCHHHPHRHGEYGLGEEDDMRRGQLLTDALSDFDLGQWMIIHGHKHHPKISYAQGSTFSPIVFSAGSLSARIWDKIQNVARNQYHLLTFDIPKVRHYKRLVGTYKSWSWFPMTGWRQAAASEGLPAEGGFGCRDIHSLVDAVSRSIPEGQARSWHDVVAENEQIKYLIPSDFEYFLRLLSAEGIGLDDERKLGKTSIKQLIR